VRDGQQRLIWPFVVQWWIAKRCISPLPLASLASSKFLLGNLIGFMFIYLDRTFFEVLCWCRGQRSNCLAVFFREGLKHEVQ
jgi:hypothetical protein